MTAIITTQGKGFSVEDTATGADYSDIEFSEAAAKRVAELIDKGTPDWDGIQPVLEREGIQILA